MACLIVTVFLNVLISSILKVFPRYGIDVLQAIAVNYLACVITGLAFVGRIPAAADTVQAAWFPWSLAIGVTFISVFSLMGFSMRINGITTTAIANKLSLVIPAFCSIYLYHEAVGAGKLAGFVLAFPAIYLTARVETRAGASQSLLLPALIFLGGGLLDTGMKFVQHQYLPTADAMALFTIFCFGTAGVIGSAVVAALAAFGKTRLGLKNIVAGIALGVPNYFSIYYYIRMLHSGFLQSSAIIPVFNISVVVASTLAAIFLFREAANKFRIAGLALSIAAILLIAFGDK